MIRDSFPVRFRNWERWVCSSDLKYSLGLSIICTLLEVKQFSRTLMSRARWKSFHFLIGNLLSKPRSSIFAVYLLTSLIISRIISRAVINRIKLFAAIMSSQRHRLELEWLIIARKAIKVSEQETKRSSRGELSNDYRLLFLIHLPGVCVLKWTLANNAGLVSWRRLRSPSSVTNILHSFSC